MSELSPLQSMAALLPASRKSTKEFLESLRQAPERDELLSCLSLFVSLAHDAKGQVFQDLWALWASGLKSGGYFVEFGALDGVNLSNTWLLEKQFGWRGILAEPNPSFHNALRSNRDCEISTECVWTRTGETMEFLVTRSAELSRLANVVPDDPHEALRLRRATTIQVQSISLNDLLLQNGAPKTIDFLSIDTEGSELTILESFDFDRWDVRALTVEHNFTAARDQLQQLLEARGYHRKFERFSRGDDWYIKAP
ncbi:MAG TPA: FkbM family methyltransferase [Caulobacteraceae bacterium]|nr:FkbM family methyltransferase [Caulobacteraceae bacterium]